ncbi:MAG: hypothetical protein U5O39_10675 [Gammaproteobacteria bacterium]|nr:hypothetical protein [Gammaproteobacteria bacterium]
MLQLFSEKVKKQDKIRFLGKVSENRKILGPQTWSPSTSPRHTLSMTPEELGLILRRQRRRQNITLASFYEGSGLTLRFMSELERGKVAMVKKLILAIRMLGFELVLVPRGQAQSLLNAGRIQRG